jgi:hypothetical protein
MHGDEKYAAVTQAAVYQMLLVTDGDDNSSRHFTLESVTDLVRKPGLPDFHLHVIAVQMHRDEKAKLEGICAPGHCTFYQVEDLARLGEALRRVSERVLQQVVCVKTTETTEEAAVMLNTRPQSAGVGATANKSVTLFNMSSALDSKGHVRSAGGGGACSRKGIKITNGHASQSYPPSSSGSAALKCGRGMPAGPVEQSLLELLRRNPSGIMGAHMASRYKEAYHRPLVLGGGRKLKDVLLATHAVKLVGGEGPGDKLFMLNASKHCMKH